MGADTAGSYGKGLLRSHTLGLLDFSDKTGKVKFGWEGQGNNFGKQLGRTALGALTFGTSEAKTGAGQYGDETIADSLFPKTINDAALGDRQEARAATDAAAKAEADAANPGPAPDLADKILSAGLTRSLQQQQSKQGRRSSFLTGSMGNVASPLVTQKTALGQY